MPLKRNQLITVAAATTQPIARKANSHVLKWISLILEANETPRCIILFPQKITMKIFCYRIQISILNHFNSMTTINNLSQKQKKRENYVCSTCCSSTDIKINFITVCVIMFLIIPILMLIRHISVTIHNIQESLSNVILQRNRNSAWRWNNRNDRVQNETTDVPKHAQNKIIA